MVKNHWAWTFQNDKATFIAIHPNRGYAAIEQIMPEGFQNNILVTDCWASYFKTDALSHQLCTAHLLRELKYLKDRYKNSIWAERMSLLIVNALALRKTDYITKVSVDEILRSFTDLINEQVSFIFK
jgi:transposase